MSEDPAELVRVHGVLLQSAQGPVPSLAELVAGGPIRGSWWAHPRSHQIYDAIEQARRSPDVVAIRLIRGKLTLVHRSLWPALFRLADRMPAAALAAVHEEHTERGAHRTTDIPFPDWVPEDVRRVATHITAAEALDRLPLGVQDILRLQP